MALEIIICVSGPGDTGKSGIVRDFTADHLGYQREEGDVLGVFPMPWRNYAVGVNGSGDNLREVSGGLRFLNHYDDLRVIIVASRSRGVTIEEVERFAADENAELILVKTEPRDEDDWPTAAREKVAEIFSHMPGRAERDA